jgi:hypothetical protein
MTARARKMCATKHAQIRSFHELADAEKWLLRPLPKPPDTSGK